MPFRNSSVALLLIAIATHSPRPLKDFVDSVPEGLSDLIDQMLEKYPKDRPSSAAVVGDQLKTLLDASASSSEASDSAAFQFAIDTEDDIPTKKAVSKKRSQKKPFVIPMIIGACVVLVAVIGYALFSESSSPPPPARTTTASPKPKPEVIPVTAEALAPLSIESVVAESERMLVGQQAQLRFKLINTAATRQNDPATLYSQTAVAGKILVFLKPKAGPGGERRAEMFPLRIAGSRIPRLGSATDLLARFDTASITPDSYDVTIRLMTPRDEAVTEAKTALTILPNYATGPLSGFTTVRTHGGAGADTTLRRGDSNQRGDANVVSVHNHGGSGGPLEHVYLRFDLSRWHHSIEEIGQAVITLTCRSSAKIRQELVLYGIPSGELSEWQESGDRALAWAKSPSQEGLGKLKFICKTTVDNTGGQLDNKTPDNVRLFDPELNAFLREYASNQVTFVIARTNKHNQNMAFFSKESDQVDWAPGLALKSR